MGKAKFQKHSAKELNAKANAHKNKGGGKTGKDKRNTCAKKVTYICDICKSMSPDMTTFTLHFVNKHPKAPFNPEEVEAKAQAAAAAK